MITFIPTLVRPAGRIFGSWVVMATLPPLRERVDGLTGTTSLLPSPEHLAQEARPDAAVAIVGRLRRGIYAHHRSEVADLPVRLDVDDDLAGNLLGTPEVGDEVGLLTGQAGRVGRLTRLEPMPIRFERWMRS